MKSGTSVAFVALALMSTEGRAAEEPVRLVQHRAVYELTLAASRGARTIEAARGRIAFDFTGDACEGYTLKFRQVTVLRSAESGEKTSDLRTANHESADGTSFRFRSDTDQGGPKQTVDGTAGRQDGKPLAVRLKEPKREQLALDGAAVFPNTQMRDLIRAAKAGKTTMSEKVYDGSDDGHKVYETLSVIGKRIEPGTVEGLEDAAKQEKLATVARWPVTISYFLPGRTDATPVYTLGFDLYENGISRALRLDYGDFTLKGEMSRLDFLPVGTCQR